ncbi:MAG: VWA domain-containing protein [Clostridia bacterium]|nr:VWA domain-containing protein [Clostridia bacterium]
MRKTRIGKSIITFALALIMVFELIPASLFTAFANDPSSNQNVYLGGADGIADRDTSMKYNLSLGDNASTEHAGRIWTDKSVYSDDATFEKFGGGTLTYKLNEGGNLGEDFLVAYSALATAESIEGQTQAPVDVVLILDVSGSMSNGDSGMDNGKSRIANTVIAANDAIKSIMELNEYTRVAVVAFSNTAQVLLPLDRYTNTTEIEREWISTGWLDGYWKETEVEVPIFSVSTEYASNNYSVLYTNAKNSKNETIERSTEVQGGTNIQMGLYTGMNILATEQSTKANINGAEIQRVPSVILLSDGSPTYSSSSESWWAPANNNNDGPGSAPYAGNGMKAILVGSYMKDAIDRNYGVTGTKFDTTVYTVGMGITGLSTNEKNLAYMTLDPGTHWNTTGQNTMRDTIKGYWNSYNNSSSVSINVGRINGNRYSDKSYTVNHPPQNDVTTYDYVDDYYDADNASAVSEVFKEIVAGISVAAPQVPTELKAGEPMDATGFITYTDPIGKYMEVKDVKAIIYYGVSYPLTSKNTNGNVTEYVFNADVDTAVHGKQNLSSIKIKVTKDANGDETLTVEIPAAIIPLRVNYVTLNSDRSVKTHTNNGAFPTRVIYSVGLKDEVVKLDSNGEYYVDKTELTDEYLAANTVDGSVKFYSNLFTNTNTVHGYSAGNATVEFEPSHTNGYYYILTDMPIYKDADFSTLVPASEDLDDNTTYFYKDEYYHGTSVEVVAVRRTGAQLKKTTIVTGTDGNLYRAAGSPRTNKILEFEGTKDENVTKTAEDFYAPTFVHAEGNPDPYEGKFVIYHGNNGVITLASGGDLSITKNVTADEGLTAPDKAFDFVIDLGSNSGTYNYVIVSANGDNVGMGTVSASNNTITLKAGQTATIYSLAPGTTYTVTETQVSGFTADKATATGTIKAGETSTVSFVNNYSVTPVSYPSSGNFEGEKIVDGRAWGPNDKFAFFFTPYNNAPLPTGYDAVNGVTVTAPDVAGGTVASFEFGTIKFTAPGVYRYTIYEKEPTTAELLPGMTYSRALYRLVVTVTDDGNGNLVVDELASGIQKLYTDDATPLFTYGANNEIVMNQGEEAEDNIVFTNKYSAGSVVRVPVALKDYTDNSGSKPLVSGMFEFKLEAVGYILEGTSTLVDSINIPMPDGAVNGVVTTHNEGKNITFPGVEFAHSDIPAGNSSITFRYKMTEVVPANSLHGMDYDTTENYIDVTISLDGSSQYLKVEAKFPDNKEIITFTNVYTPDPAVTSIDGNKTLIGRDVKSGDNFEFVLSGADAETLAAIAAGTVVIPANKTYVTSGTDGVKAPFDFANIQFKKVGTYTFTVNETAGSALSVEYDDSVVTVTVVIADDNNDGRLEVKSATYSNGGNAAEFVNNYTTKFDGTPVSLDGTKKLTGKTLLAGEFFFDIIEYYNGVKVSEGLVSHAEDTTADANGVYEGSIKFIENKTYTKAGKYTYYITEQVPNPKVGGTTYDSAEYRFTVVVEDVEKIGKLTVTSKYIEKKDGNDWVSAGAIEFVNEYVPTPTTTSLPLIKKVLTGDRAEALKAGEFEFKLSIVSQSPEGGIVLPATTVVSNGADGSIVFDKIKFTKAGTYTVSVTEVVPTGSEAAKGIEYSTQTITATYTVTDNRNGVLTAVLSRFVGGEVIINKYKADPAAATITIEKNFTGRNNDEWLPTDKFDFEVVVLDPATQEAIENGAIKFPLDAGSGNIVTKTIASKGATIDGKVDIYRPGTYKFIVREITGTIPGVHYDSEPRNIEIVATDDSANAEIDITINGNAVDQYTITFTNKYNPDSTELSGHDNLTINKVFTGRTDDEWLDTDEFEFKLEAGDTATANAITAGKVVLPDETTLTVSNANKAHPHFGNIVFNAEGTYVFKVTELEGNIPGVTYDKTPRMITVKVENNATLGALVASIDASSDSLTFNNSYKAAPVTLEGATNLEIIKVLEGRDWNSADEFKFILKPYGKVGEDAIAAGKIVLANTELVIRYAPNAIENNSIKGSFGNITFYEAGTYRFEIVEEVGSLNNVAYDDHRHYVTVIVSDNDQGQLVTSTSYLGSNVFINRYNPDDAKVVIEGEKKLSGNRPLGADEFEFVIEAVTTNAPMPSNNKVKNDGNGKVSFGEIIYTAAGTYKYKITETVPTNKIPGVTYDTEAVEVTVKVTYDSALGTYSTAVEYTKGTVTGTTFTINNSYKAEESEPISIPVKKEVTPSTGNSYSFKGGEFEFVMEAITAGAPMPTNSTVTNDTNGNALFEGLVFDEKGEYKYFVTEKAGSLKGMEYDDFRYIVTVNVTDNTAIAKLETSVKISGENSSASEIIFRNKYTPIAALANIFGSKKLDGGYRTVKANDFKFKLEAVTADAPLPITTEVFNDANASFAFDSITFTKVGVYEYKVSEVDLGVHGYGYDTKPFTVKVTVTDVNGELKAVVDGIGSAVNPEIVFVNTYTPDSGEVIIEGTKKLEGKRDLKANDFEFVISAVTPNAPMPSNNKVKNDGNGTVTFGKIEYTKSGVYEYEITETVPTKKISGVTYDTDKVKVTVNVTFDDATGKLVAVASYEKGGNTGNTFEFKNTYKADDTDPVVIKVEKVVTSSSGKNYKLNGGDFNFVINGTANAPLPNPTTVSNDKFGKASFGGITFEKEGTYVYTVTEESGTLGGMTYDDAEYTVTVTVTDNTEKGKLEATVKITDENNADAQIVFNNKYDPKEVSATFFGEKELDSEHKQLEADEFKFVLEAVTANAPMPTTTEVTNTVTGAFRFGAITFTKVGTYEYKITEKDLGLKGYTYDTNSFTVKVTVTDEGNGVLKAEVDGLGTESAPTVKFVNKYAPAPTKVVLGEKGELSKKLNGRELKANEFEFILLDSADKELAVSKNDKDGKFEFTVEYSKAGTYTYKIVEKNNALGGVTYDEKVYAVTVEVVDKNGELEVKSFGYKLENSDVTEVVFTNTYKAAPVEIQLEAEKLLRNRELVEGEFVFEIKGEDGKTVKIASNTADGKVIFEKIKLESAGTFKYTVSEVQGNLDGVIYDKTVYNVVVTVTDNGEGKLEAAEPVITNAKNNIAVTKMGFDNTYLPPEVPKTGDRRHLPIWFALMFISGGAAITLGIADKKKKNAKA